MFVVAVAACGSILIIMAVFPYMWLSFVLAIVFGASFSVAIVIALTLVQRETEDEVRGRIMGGVQMLFRIGLGARCARHGRDREQLITSWTSA